jgi:adenylate cyclase, class 2
LLENETKLRVAGPEPARAALARLGATCVRPRCLEDNLLLDDAAGSLAASGSLLRLRRTPGKSVLTFKGPRSVASGVKSREELEVSLSDPDAAETIFARLGFRGVFRYQKYRETYHWQDVEIVVDETPIGTFLEIEGPPEAIHATAAALGHRPDEFITDSYAGLYFAAGGTGDMLFGDGA